VPSPPAPGREIEPEDSDEKCEPWALEPLTHLVASRTDQVSIAAGPALSHHMTNTRIYLNNY
jgi:hypothetical protein